MQLGKVSLIITVLGILLTYFLWNQGNTGTLHITTSNFPVSYEYFYTEDRVDNPKISVVTQTTESFELPIGNIQLRKVEPYVHDTIAYYDNIIKTIQIPIERNKGDTIDLTRFEYGQWLLNVSPEAKVTINGEVYPTHPPAKKHIYTLRPRNYQFKIVLPAQKRHEFIPFYKEVTIEDGAVMTSNIGFDAKKQVLSYNHLQWKKFMIDTAGIEQACKGEWRLPTLDDWEELLNGLGVVTEEFSQENMIEMDAFQYKGFLRFLEAIEQPNPLKGYYDEGGRLNADSLFRDLGIDTREQKMTALIYPPTYPFYDEANQAIGRLFYEKTDSRLGMMSIDYEFYRVFINQRCFCVRHITNHSDK